MSRLAVVGNPGHRRTALFQTALSKRGGPNARVFPWIDLPERLDELEQWFPAGGTIRLESPGQDFEVEKKFLAIGAAIDDPDHLFAERIEPEVLRGLPSDRGRILAPRQWYRGFRSVLQSLARRFAGRADMRWMQCPAEVEALFDKDRTAERFRAAGLPVPGSLANIRNFDSLIDAMRIVGFKRIFAKPLSGSSASGVVAFAMDATRMRATTTVEIAERDGEPLLYNSRKVRSLNDPCAIGLLIDRLAREGMRVEEWIPKAGYGGSLCDLRVLTIGGREAHTVVRRSRSPITNLHLRNERGEPDALKAVVGGERWDAAMADCRRAAACFPGCHHLGIDLLFAAGPSNRHYFLEANAFGDLLNDVAWNGMTTHEAELAAWEADA